MTHEFKNIIASHVEAKKLGLKTVLVTVVDLDGSSYRKPGVRMLVLENNKMIGAVSGGCVEKEILRQSKSVFESGKPKIMTYDGRFRLGCEGFLFILLEILNPKEDFINTFKNCLKERVNFQIESRYCREEGEFNTIGSFVKINDSEFSLSEDVNVEQLNASKFLTFSQVMEPCFKLIIFGSEHDTVQLCQFAALTGWEVSIVTKPSEYKTIQSFPGATEFISSEPENIDFSVIDNQTAVMIMTHSFANDLKCLIALKDHSPIYIGLLGPVHKRENLLSQLLEYYPDIEDAFFDKIYGPAGLNIGSETPQEISISIISEILSITRHKTPMSLKEKTRNTHA